MNGKAVQIRRCPATVTADETCIVPFPDPPAGGSGEKAQGALRGK
jgi:hypothetical protein